MLVRNWLSIDQMVDLDVHQIHGLLKSLNENQAVQKKSHDEHSREQTFFIGQRVMARNYRAGSVWMPGTVVERNGPLSYLIKVNGGQLWKCHIDQLRVRLGDAGYILSSAGQNSTGIERL